MIKLVLACFFVVLFSQNATGQHRGFGGTTDDDGALPVSLAVEVNTNQTNGVPPEYTGLTAGGVRHQVTKGQLNKIRARPRILNEHQESSRTSQGTVDSSTIVGQIFRVSQDNINSIALTMSTGGGVLIDGFGYLNNGLLQAEWSETTNGAIVETTIVEALTQSMNLPLDAADDEWVKTVAATDYENWDFVFNYQQNREFANAQVAFWVGDGTRTKSIVIPVNFINTWSTFEVNEAAMSFDNGATFMQITATTQIGFRVIQKSATRDAYVNQLVALPPPGSADLKLFDMGSTLPVGGVASLSDGTQYNELGDLGIIGITETFIRISLSSGVRYYNVLSFCAGVALEHPLNELLNVGNYYALTVNYVDTDVVVYGADTSFNTDYYNSGYAFTASIEAFPITKTGNLNDIMFDVYSTQDIYLTGFSQNLHDPPGTDATVNIFAEDPGMKKTGIANSGGPALQNIFADLGLRPYFVVKGSKIEIYYQDDFTDDVSIIDFTIAFLHIPPIPYN